MERLYLDDNSPPLDVLDGQTCIDEVFAELGFDWRAGCAAPGMAADGSQGGLMGQAALF